jgi:hypothetical protein
MEYYSAKKKNESVSFAGRWIELEIIMLSEISQAQKAKFCMFFSCVESRPKMKMMRIMMMMMMTGHECKGRLFGGESVRRWK